MAGPIKISILADAAQAVKEVTKFSDVVDSETKRVVTTLGDSKLQGNFGKVQEGFDVAEQRAMGFRDTITGVQDSVSAFNILSGKNKKTFDDLSTSVDSARKKHDSLVATYNALKSAKDADAQTVNLYKTKVDESKESLKGLEDQLKAAEQGNKSFGDGLLLVGSGVGDLASGFANFIVPLVAVGAGLKTFSIGTQLAAVGTKIAAAGQWLLNAAMTANPIGIVVVAIIALVAILVVAYKKSETFRRIVDGAFRGVVRAAQAAWNWIKGNWPLLLAIITGPIGLAVRFVARNWDKITAGARAIPGKIRAVFSNVGSLLTNAGRNIVNGLLGGIRAKFEDVKALLGRLTNLLPDWKGPASKDKEILSGPADLIMDGFIGQLESRYQGVRQSLGRFTDTLGAEAGGGAVALGGAAGGSAGRTPTVVLEFAPTGDRILDAILEALKDSIRIKGGNVQKVLGA